MDGTEFVRDMRYLLPQPNAQGRRDPGNTRPCVELLKADGFKEWYLLRKWIAESVRGINAGFRDVRLAYSDDSENKFRVVNQGNTRAMTVDFDPATARIHCEGPEFSGSFIAGAAEKGSKSSWNSNIPHPMMNAALEMIGNSANMENMGEALIRYVVAG